MSRMNCQMFSTGLSSGDRGGSGIRVMLWGTSSLEEVCPACPVEDDNAVRAGVYCEADLGEMRTHRMRVTTC